MASICAKDGNVEDVVEEDEESLEHKPKKFKKTVLTEKVSKFLHVFIEGWVLIFLTV
jgi:hypothetical protein